VVFVEEKAPPAGGGVPGEGLFLIGFIRMSFLVFLQNLLFTLQAYFYGLNRGRRAQLPQGFDVLFRQAQLCQVE